MFKKIRSRIALLLYSNRFSAKLMYFTRQFRHPPCKFFKRDDLLFNRSKNFEEYFESCDLNYAEKIKSLCRNTDEESHNAVNRLIKNYAYVYRHDLIERTFWEEQIDKVRLEQLSNKRAEKFRTKPHQIFFRYSDTLFYCSGLFFVPANIIASKQETDCFDCGAYNGDTATIFEEEFNFRKIYAFEPVKDIFSLLLETISVAGLKKVVPIMKGVSEKTGILSMAVDGECSRMTSDALVNTVTVDITTIDDFVTENNLTPGVIKMDIEGHELSAVKGALKSIKKFRPILLICVYHSPQDLFEIKPLLEDTLTDYTFLFRHLDHFHPVYETMLIAYPNY